MQFANIVPRLCLCLLFIHALYAVPSAAGDASNPIDVIKAGTDQALEILKTRGANGKRNLRERRNEIFKIVDQYFDFDEMAKRALGRAWKHQPQQKRSEFVKLFKDLLFNTYVDQVENYTGSNEKVVFDSEEIDGKYAVVGTRVVGYKDKDVTVVYRLCLRGGKWKAYDVIIEGISLVNNYRSQFSSILSRKSFDELLKIMRNKVNSLNKTA